MEGTEQKKETRKGTETSALVCVCVCVCVCVVLYIGVCRANQLTNVCVFACVFAGVCAHELYTRAATPHHPRSHL